MKQSKAKIHQWHKPYVVCTIVDNKVYEVAAFSEFYFAEDFIDIWSEKYTPGYDCCITFYSKNV